MKLKSLMGDFIAYTFNSILLKILSIITLPILTRIFSVDEYGAIETISSSIALLPTFIGLGYDVAVLKELVNNKDQEQRQKTVTTISYFLSIWGGVVIVAGILFSNNISLILFGTADYSTIIKYALFLTYANLFSGLSVQLLRVEFRKKAFMVVSIGQSVCQYAAIIFAVAILKSGIEGYFQASLVTTIIWSIIGLMLNQSLFHGKFDLHILKRLICFGVPIMISSLAYWVFNLSDRLVLTHFTNLEQTGLYSMAVKMTSILTLVATAFGQAWTPRAYEIYASEPDKYSEFMETLHPILMSFFVFIALINVAVGRLMLVLFSTQNYLSSLYIMIPLAFSAVFQCMSKFVSMGIYFKNRTANIAKNTWISAIVNFGINIFFMKKYGAIVGGVSTLISYIYLYTVYYIMTCRYLKSKPVIIKPIIPVVIGMLITAIINGIKINNIFLDAIIKILITFIYPILLLNTHIISLDKIRGFKKNIYKGGG